MNLYARISVITLMSIILGFSESYSQVFKTKREKDGKVYEYKLLESEPNDGNNWYAGVDFMNLDMGPGFYMGFGLHGRYIFNEQLMFNLSYFRPYFSGTDSEFSDRSENAPTADPAVIKLYNKTEVGITYFFAASEGVKKVRIRLDHEMEGNTSVVTYAENRIPTETKYGVRGGYHYYQSTVQGNYYVDTLPSVPSLMNPQVTLSAFTVNSLYIGLSATKFRHYLAETKALGNTYSSHLRNFYLDVFYGLGGNNYFDLYRSKYELNKDFDMYRFGWRFGWENFSVVPMTRHVGGRIGLEFGQRPSPNIPNIGNNDSSHDLARFYFNFKVGIVFGGKV